MDKKNIEGIFPLSPPQQGMLYYLVLSNEYTDAFYEQYTCRLRGDLDLGLFKQAWEQIVQRHASLRTLFLWERREKPIQVVLRTLALDWEEEDLRHLSEAEQNEYLENWHQEDRRNPFKMNKAPLHRFRVFKLGDNVVSFSWCYSHLLADGWSIGLIIPEVYTLYGALADGRPSPLERAYPFRDYIAWLQKVDAEEGERYWAEQLAGLEPPKPLAIDRRSATADGQKPDVGSHSYLYDDTRINEIDEAARELKVTRNVLFQGAWSLLLHHYSNSNDVVFGGITSGRPPELTGVDTIVGQFTNILATRVKIDPSRKVSDWLSDLQMQLVEQRQHEYCRLEDIARASGFKHDEDMFDTMFIYESYPTKKGDVGEQKLQIDRPHVEEQTQYALVCYLSPQGGLNLRICFDRARFRDEDVVRFTDHYRSLVDALSTGDKTVGDIQLVNPAEKKAILAQAHNPVVHADAGPVHLRFEEQARKNPNRIALAYPGGTMTYADLNAAANRLAHRLRGAGVGRDVLVGLSLPRSPELIASLLAILKVGGAYLPLDPDYPADRLAFMVEDSGVGVVIASPDLHDCFPKVATVIGPNAEGEDETNPEYDTDLAQLVYIVYTSGSTGKPKGVMVTHGNLANYIEDTRIAYHIGADSRVLQFATINFDTSAEEIWPSLVCGATLVLRSDEMIGSTKDFLNGLRDDRISFVSLPTAFWHQVTVDLDEEDCELPADLRVVVLGGEAALADRLARWRRHVSAAKHPVRIINTYGPTEATIVASRIDVSDHNEDEGDVPIGIPIGNGSCHVLDAHGNPLPQGLPGELLIGGAGVARGYLNRPALTAERFVPDAFGEAGARVYRSGDLVSRLDAGNLAFRGRVDHQVKIRGFRVEPGEIEDQLAHHPDLGEVAVVAGDDVVAGKRLIAYYVARDEDISPTATQLREFLAKTLPDYMIPAIFVALPAMPMTPSKKIDRKALPDPDTSRLGVLDTYEEPRNPMEQILADIWGELLGLDTVGIRDNFFELGGHSLLVGRLGTRIKGALGIEVAMADIFENATIAELAAHIENLDETVQTGLPPIELCDRSKPIPLSFPQERVWFLHQLSPSSIAYNFQVVIYFRGPLEPETLQRTLTEIIRRHEIFRTRFPEQDGRPVQVIEAPYEAALPMFDLRHLPEEDRQAAAEKHIFDQTQIPFDVTQLPLIRWNLLRLGDENYQLVQVEHHFVHDGWSLSLFLREMKAIYEPFSLGEESALPELEVQYADFATWQRKNMDEGVMSPMLDFWKKSLEGMPALLELPTDRPRPTDPKFLGESVMFALPDDVYDGLRAFSRAQGFTLYMTMLATYYVLLYRHTGQKDLIVGAGAANRKGPAMEAMIGMMVNSIVMRLNLEQVGKDGEPTFREVLEKTRRLSLEAYSHQEMPFDRLVQELRPQRQAAVNPLFQTMFSFHDAAVPHMDFGGMEVAFLVRTNRSAKLDLNVIVAPQAEQQVGGNKQNKKHYAIMTWEYNRDLFDDATMERMRQQYINLLRTVVKHPEERVSKLSMLSQSDIGFLEFDRDPGAAPYPKNWQIQEIFEETAASHPDDLALCFGDERVSYGEMNKSANRMARRLVDLGVGPDTLVTVGLERCIELYVAMLAILKAGGAYVPLDPVNGAHRLKLMLEDLTGPDGQPPVLITKGVEVTDLLPHVDFGERIIHVENPEPEGLDDRNLPAPGHGVHGLAYVVFTSGSTNRPKGVAVGHQAVVRLTSPNNFMKFEVGDIWLQYVPVSFDMSTLEIWGPLLNRGAIAIAPPGKLSKEEISDCVNDLEVTVAFLTSGLFRQFVEEDHLRYFSRVRLFFTGGDALGASYMSKARQMMPNSQLVAAYGPSENTTFTTAHIIESEDDVADSRGTGVPLGRPVTHSSVFVLDGNLNPIPIGVLGELCCTGDGLARGYLHRPGLTAEVFVPNPFATQEEAGSRLYKSGDLVRYQGKDDGVGNLEFIGRRDHQVKVRGFRIELAEIQGTLLELDGVQACAAVVRGDANKHIVAYIVPEDNTSAEELIPLAREYARSQLPDFMLPSIFVALEEMPLTISGKLDTKALPEPDANRTEEEGSAPFVAPSTPDQQKLADYWCESLELDKVGIHDHFFELGGHSLLATRMISFIRREWGIVLKLATFFAGPTIAEVAEFLAEAKADHSADASAAIEASSDDREDDALLEQAESMDDDDLDALLGSMMSDGGDE